MDKETRVPRSRGRSLVVLFNTARPHSSLGYQTPTAYVEVIPATGSGCAWKASRLRRLLNPRQEA